MASIEPAVAIRRQPEFTTTRWSVVLRAGGASAEDPLRALEQLCADYWYPLYAYVRRKGYSPEDAADLTQSFFAKLLANNFTAGLSAEGGRFRSFLLTAINRFLINEWEKGQRHKRGSGAAFASLEAMIQERGEAGFLADLSHDETPEHLFQRAWAETFLRRVLERLQEECAARGDPRFAVLRPFLAPGTEAPSLQNGAERLGLTVAAFKSLLHRFRERYRELLISEVQETVGTRAEVADELRGLLAALRG